jgi:hypothetical protein
MHLPKNALRPQISGHLPAIDLRSQAMGHAMVQP